MSQGLSRITGPGITIADNPSGAGGGGEVGEVIVLCVVALTVTCVFLRTVCQGAVFRLV